MRGRVIAVLFSSILFVSAALPQCNYQLQSSWQFRASYLDLALDGNDLWAATGYGIQLFDRSVEPLRFIASAAVPGLTRVVRARDGVAYAASGTSLYVMRRADRRLEIVRSLDLGATINDLLLQGSTLMAATASGIVPLDIGRPLEPAALPAQLAGRNIHSLARSDLALFAGDGDNSVEVLTPSASAGLTPIASISRGMSVNVIGARLYVSDGQQTDVFNLNGTTAVRLGTMPLGATSLVGAGANVVFAAGNDRRVRAVGISTVEAPVDLFAVDVPVTLGTINRVGAIQSAGSRLYIGGGDSGLFVYDTSAFTPPYPVRSYLLGSKTSITASNTAVYVANATGGLTELTRSSGSLTPGRTWGGATELIAHDNADDFLLTSSDKTLTYWTVRSASPAVVSTAAFNAAVKSAVLSGSIAYALLADGTLWSADLAQTVPVPVRIGTGTYQFLDRYGPSIATAEVTNDATTVIRVYSNGNLNSTPASATVPGAATTFALGSSFAAVFTFRGITVVDFSATTPLQTVLPQSATATVTDLAFAGGKLLDVTFNAVRLWNLPSFTLERKFALTQPLLIAAAADVRFAAATTADGVASILYESASQQPSLSAAVAGNEFPRKAVGGDDRLYLFDSTSVDVFETARNVSPRFITSIPVQAVIDIAASDSAVFTLSSTGTVTMYPKSGTAIRTGTLNEGSDVVPSAIFAVRGAPWVAFSKGCVTTGCESKTSVFDPQTMAITASLPGGVIDAVAAGSNAAAIFELPNEVRYYDVNDPLHPSQIGSRAVEGAATSIATGGNSVFTLGDKLYAYSAPGLFKTGEHLAALAPTATSGVAIDGACALVARADGNNVYAWSAGEWASVASLPMPSGTRSVVVQPERFIILTDHSAEIWSRGAATPPRRRRAAR